jgi:hypothetical protein
MEERGETVDEGIEWSKEGAKWKRLQSLGHGFNGLKMKGEKEKAQTMAFHELCDDIGGWL